MSLVYEEFSQKSTRLQKLFKEIEQHFEESDVDSIDSYRLTESLGVQIQTATVATAVATATVATAVATAPAASSEPLIVDSFLREAKCFTEHGVTSAQIKTLKESTAIELSIGSSPTVTLKPGQLHKKTLPELLKADLWHTVTLDKGKLAEVLDLVGKHKQVERDGVTYHFDEDLDWLVQDDAYAVTVYAKSEKFGLVKKVRENVHRADPPAALTKLKALLGAEIDLLAKSMSLPSLTQPRRDLMRLEIETDTTAAEFLI